MQNIHLLTKMAGSNLWLKFHSKNKIKQAREVVWMKHSVSRLLYFDRREFLTHVTNLLKNRFQDEKIAVALDL